MKRGLLIVALVVATCSMLYGQAPQGELEVYYQTIQNFDFDSGSPQFSISDEAFHGGGFGFVFYLNDWFGLFSNTSLYGGIEENAIDLKLINQVQGVKLIARDLGIFNVYTKGGIGFARYVFELQNLGETVRYGTSFLAGAGLEVRMSDNIYFLLEGNQTSLSLPDISGSPNRDKWDSTLGFLTGIALQF